MDWTSWLVVLCAIGQLLLSSLDRYMLRLRAKKMRDFLMKSAAQSTQMAEHWRTVAENDTKPSPERMTAVHTATVLLGSSIAYQDAAQDVDSFLVHGERLGQRGAIKVDEKAVKPEAAGAA